MTEWRRHAKLQELFHVDHPDDVQVMVHDGGPRLTEHRPELVWVTVTKCEGDLFSGRVLNKPDQLDTVQAGSQIKFVASGKKFTPLMVTDKYLSERPNWIIRPCDKCGLSELFDAPSDLMTVAFPDMPEGAIMEMFTSFCGVCGGVQIVEYKDGQMPTASGPLGNDRKWWQFWK